MEREEAINFLRETKICVGDKSKEVQEKLYELGFSTIYGKRVICCEEQFIYVNGRKIISFDSDQDGFTEDPRKEITPGEILSISIPENPYRPFLSDEECWEELQNHQPLGWVMLDNERDGRKYMIISLDSGINLSDQYGNNNWSYLEALDNIKFIDGKPFGIKKY